MNDSTLFYRKWRFFLLEMTNAVWMWLFKLLTQTHNMVIESLTYSSWWIHQEHNIIAVHYHQSKTFALFLIGIAYNYIICWESILFWFKIKRNCFFFAGVITARLSSWFRIVMYVEVYDKWYNLGWKVLSPYLLLLNNSYSL